MNRRLKRQAIVNGSITFPAVPGMLEDYVDICADTFASFGVTFSADETAHLRSVLAAQLKQAFDATSRSQIVVTYESPIGNAVNYHVKAQWLSVDAAYNNWVATREPPLFGTEPDARVWALATTAADPADFPVLDIGAGTGRNSLALARRGHPVDAVEMTEKFADIIRSEAQAESLNVRVIERNVFAADQDHAEGLRGDYGLILLSEVVSDFRSVEEVRSMFELAARCLAPGGRLVFNVFLPRHDYVPDDAARELGQQFYTSIFTYSEVADAAAQFGLYLEADDSVYDYEQANLPAGAWPQTRWYADWVSGRDVFDVPREDSPIQMRWLVFRMP
jgi:2-polyprenyl-3-methyl-5-hydroxy-6-metoxy-1,4-benzoquinol methylase